MFPMYTFGLGYVFNFLSVTRYSYNFIFQFANLYWLVNYLALTYAMPLERLLIVFNYFKFKFPLMDFIYR